MHKATKILSCLLAFSALVVLSGCSGYKTKPEVTGGADDGLYLYCGNMRYTSDYQNGEELVSSLDIEGFGKRRGRGIYLLSLQYLYSAAVHDFCVYRHGISYSYGQKGG